MAISIDRDYVRERYFEAKDKEDATGVAHYQTLLEDVSFSPQSRLRESVSFIGQNSLKNASRQLLPQAHDLRLAILSGKMIKDLSRGSSLSPSEVFNLDVSLTEALIKNQKCVWYRLNNASYESSALELCLSFFASRPVKEELSIKSYLIFRLIDLSFCRENVRPPPEFLEKIRYLFLCKIPELVNARISVMEREKITLGQREHRKKELLQKINTVRERATTLQGKLADWEKRPLLDGEEMRLIKQTLGLYETEMNYALALSKVAGKEEYLEELRCIMGLGKLYSQKGEKQTYIQAAGLYNYAFRLIEDPQIFPIIKPEIRISRREEILDNLGQIELRLLRLMRVESSQDTIERAKYSIVTNRKRVREIRKGIDEAIEKLGEEPAPQQIADIHRLIANQMKLFTAQLIKQCIVLLGRPPCNYAVIGLGSMARQEMTHYSDLEFAILIEERRYEEMHKHKEYFRNLTYLLHLKVIDLGETILPALNIPCLSGESGIGFFDAVTPRGLAFDGAGMKGKGCKTPLGNGTTFELIQTPKEMAQYLGRDNDGVDWPKSEPHLPMELLNFTLICASEEKLIEDYRKALHVELSNPYREGEEKLLEDYQKALHLELSNPYRKGVDLRNYLARMHLVSDDERLFDPTLGNLEKEGQLFKVKQDLYRFPHLSIDRLALLSNLQVLSTFDRIKELNRIGILNTTASERLQCLICEAIFQRLKVYSHYKAQQELMNPLIKAFGFEDSQLGQKQFALDPNSLKKLTRIYQVLLPFYQAIQAFLKGNSSVLQQEKLWDESDFTLGQIAARLLQYEQAEMHYLKAEGSVAKQDKGRLLNDLGLVELQLNKEQKALFCFQKSLEISEKAHGKEHPAVAKSLNNIGMVYKSLGNAQTALSFLQRALVIWEKVYSKEHSHVAMSLNNIGMVYDSLGKVQEALSFLQRALIILEKVYGKEHPHVASSLNNIGSVYDSLGKVQEALCFHQRALAISKKIYGQEHPAIAMSLNNIGMVYDSLRKAQEALSFYQRALIILEKIYGKEHPHVASSLNNIGMVYNSLGNAQEALSFLQRALVIWEKVYGKEHPDVALSLNNIGMVYDSLGKAQEALSFYQRALVILEKIYGQEHPHVASSLNNIGMVYDSLGKAQEALFYCQKALVIREKIYGQEHPHVASSLNNIGMVYDSLGKAQEALFYYQKALVIWEKVYGNEHPLVIESRKRVIAATYQMIEHPQQKIEFVLAAWDKMQKGFKSS